MPNINLAQIGASNIDEVLQKVEATVGGPREGKDISVKTFMVVTATCLAGGFPKPIGLRAAIEMEDAYDDRFNDGRVSEQEAYDFTFGMMERLMTRFTSPEALDHAPQKVAQLFSLSVLNNSRAVEDLEGDPDHNLAAMVIASAEAFREQENIPNMEDSLEILRNGGLGGHKPKRRLH